jgi:YD repeat-containing protein
MRLLIIVLSCIILSFYSFAQDIGSLPQYQPIAPNAAALFKTFEKPAESYTGIPSISIPLYSYGYKGYNLAVSLNYNAGGIKVEEYASTAGLGWSLSTGGMITRIVRGDFADETYPVGYLHNSYKPSQFSQTHLVAYANGIYDAEPDLFLFNFNGISGKFIFNDSGKVYVIESNVDVKVQPIRMGQYNQVGAYAITDDKGLVYYFGFNKAGTVYAKDLTLGADSHYASWQLMEVYDMNGTRLAAFDYSSVTSSNETRLVAALSVYFSGTTTGCDAGDNNMYDRFIGGSVSEYLIQKITIGPEIVQFNYGSRIDGQPVKLNSVEVRDAANTLRKKFNFNYDYFGQSFSNYGGPLTETQYNARYRRLKLKNVSEQPVSGTDSLTHSFTYEESVNLPDRYSNNVDYWGYYNGNVFNTSIIPNGIYTWMTTTVGVRGYGERRANAAVAIANTLKRISFPSGGYRQFEYEGNQALYRHYAYTAGNLTPDADDHITRSFDTTAFVHINGMPAYTHDFVVNSSNGYAFFNYDIEGFSSGLAVKIYKSGGLIATFTNDYDNYYFLSNGNYTIRVEDNYNFPFLESVHCWWDELNLTNNTISQYNDTYKKQNQQVGGLRIKTIDDYDPLTNKHQYTRYKYWLPGDTSLTSGMLVSYPRLLYRTSCPSKQCDRIRIASQSNYPLNSDGGSYVVYPNIRVIEDGNGYTDSYYRFEPDLDWTFFEFPANNPESRATGRGQLLSRRYFNQAGSLLQLDSMEYIAKSGDDPPFNTCWGYKISLYNTSTGFCTNGGMLGAGVNYQPQKETTTRYTASGNLQTKTEYDYYHALNKRGIRRLKVTNNDGFTTDTWRRYAYNANTDFKLGLSIADKSMKDTLLVKNYLAPLEVTTYRKKDSDSIFMSGTKSTFGYFHTVKKYPAAVKTFTALTDSTVLNFSAYDTAGNVQEQYLTNNAKEVYLWGYNNKYVVAKVVGSDLATVAALVNNAVLQSPANDATLRTELNKIRTGLAGSQARVTTYTWLPAVGISSVTDYQGNTQYYEYDSLGRATRIRDTQNGLLKKFNYINSAISQ